MKKESGIFDVCKATPEIINSIASHFADKIASRIMPATIFMDLLLTEDCNCACDYCFVDGKNDHNRITPKLAKRAIDFLLERSGNEKDLGILLFGGEPLLEFDLIKLIVRYAKKASRNGKTITFSMTTNGTLMTEKMMRYFQRHNIRYLLSLDGGERSHNRHRKFKNGTGSFDVVAEKLSLMKHYQPWLGARVTPTPETIEYLYRDVQELYSLGINQFIIGLASGVEWTEEDGKIYLREMRKLARFYREERQKGGHIRLTVFEKSDLDDGGKFDLSSYWGCGAGRARISVNTRGEIFGCARLASVNGLCGTLKLGDLGHGFYELQARSLLMDNSISKRTACKTCTYQDRCSGGCPAINMADTGNIFTPSPYECFSTRLHVRLRKYTDKLLSELRKN